MGQSDAYVRCPLRGFFSERGALSYDVRFLLFVLIALAAIAGMTLTAAFFTASRNEECGMRNAELTAREIDFFSPNPDVAEFPATSQSRKNQ